MRNALRNRVLVKLCIKAKRPNRLENKANPEGPGHGHFGIGSTIGLFYTPKKDRGSR
jgi:hypothetical protein